MISNLLAPKWKHKNPQVRKQALLALDAARDDSQNIFLDIVENDPELFLRRMALRRITMIDVVQDLRQATQNDELYQEATNRLCVLLSADNSGLNIEELKVRLDKLNETGVYLYVVKHTNNEELQKFILDRLDNENAIVDIVIHAQNSQVQQQALAKLKSTGALKRVIKSLKRKDKSLMAQAEQTLRQIEHDVEEKTKLRSQYKNVRTGFLELLELCKLSGEWAKNESRLRGLYEQWHGLRVQLGQQDISDDNEQEAKVEKGLALFEEELKNSAENKIWEIQERETNSELLEELRGIKDQLMQQLQVYSGTEKKQWPTVTELSDFIADIKQQWKSKCIGNVDGGVSDGEIFQLKSDFESGLMQLEILLSDLPKINQYQSKMTEIINDARKLRSSGLPSSKQRIEKLQQRYKKLSPPEKFPVDKNLFDQFQKLISELEKQCAEQDKKRIKIISQFGGIVLEITEAISKGRSKYAAQLLHRGKKLIKQLDEDGRNQLDKRGDLSAFSDAEQKLGNLQDWRQWSNVPVKERLIKEMQNLAEEVELNRNSASFDFVNAADLIKAARKEWQNLASGEYAGDQALWQRFDAACNQAYEPCQHYFGVQSEQRTENLSRRQQFCQELELYLQKVSELEPDKVDWKAMAKIIHTARKDWGQLGIVNRGDRGKINKRFNHTLHALEKLLRSQQRQNREIKETLTKRVQTTAKHLSEQAISIEQAIESVKQAEVEWKEVGKADKESRLWQQFRSECDVVFQVRRAEQQTANQLREQEKQQRSAMIKDIEAAAKLSGDSLQQARSQVEQIKSEWDQLPRLKKDHSQERHFFRAINQFEKQLEHDSTVQLRSEKKLIQHNVSLCNQLEELIYDNLKGVRDFSKLIDSVTDIRQRWQPVSPKLRVVDQAVQSRFEQLADYVKKITGGNADEVKGLLSDSEEELASRKDLLCIQIEVLADLPSPVESKQRRMEFQVAQLADRMKQARNHNKDKEIEELISEWHQSGFMNSAKSRLLEQRFYSALQSLDKDYEYK